MTTKFETRAPSGASAPLRHRTRRRIEVVLAGLGLRVHPDKTRFVFLVDGQDDFNFLGFHHGKTSSTFGGRR